MFPFRLVLPVLAALAGAPALACSWQPPLDLTAAPAAEAIFVGDLLSYDPVPLPGNPRVVTHATATFAVRAVIAGDPPATVTVLMLDNLTGVPEQWRWDARVIVATLPPGTPDTAWSEPHNPRPDLPVVLHPTCGTPFIAPDDAETRAGIARALAGK